MISQTLFELAILFVVPLLLISPIVIIVIIFTVGPLRKYSGIVKDEKQKKNLNVFQKIICYFNNNKLKFIIYIVIGYFISLLLFDLTPFGGNVRYYIQKSKCNTVPYVYSNFLGHSYDEPTQDRAPIRAFRGFDKYYCSSEDAYNDPFATSL